MALLHYDTLVRSRSWWLCWRFVRGLSWGISVIGLYLAARHGLRREPSREHYNPAGYHPVAAAFTSDGNLLAGATGKSHHGKRQGEIDVWDAATGKRRWTASLPVEPSDVAITHDDQAAVTLETSATGTGTMSYCLRFWNIATGKTSRVFLRLLPRNEAVHLTLSPDNHTLAVYTEGQIDLWDREAGTLLRTFKPNADSSDTRSLSWVSFAENGRRLIVVSGADAAAGRRGAVELWDARTGQRVRVFEQVTTSVLEASLSPDGTWLATLAPDVPRLRIWDVETGTCQAQYDLQQSAAAQLSRPRALGSFTGSTKDRLVAVAVDSRQGDARGAELLWRPYSRVLLASNSLGSTFGIPANPIERRYLWPDWAHACALAPDGHHYALPAFEAGQDALFEIDNVQTKTMIFCPGG